MQPDAYTSPHEPLAKAALLDYLRSTGQLRARSSAVLELGIAKLSNRADVAVIDDELHCFEIKTKQDKLTRLAAQIEAYTAAADTVTVVGATRHINAILSSVPDYVGVMEIVDFGAGLQVRPVREAHRSPVWSASEALSFLPVKELRRLLPECGSGRRQEMVTAAKDLPAVEQRQAVNNFLKARYRASTRAFLKAVRQRSVRPEDLALLRIWERREIAQSAPFPLSTDRGVADRDLYQSIGQSFGSVPDEIRALLDQSTHSSSIGD